MKTVTIYTTPTCGFCAMTKRFFGEHNVTYTEKDVSRDVAAAQEMIERSGQMGVPVTIVSDGEKEELIVGFDRARLASVIGIQESS
jgi:glutaredoxin